MSVSALRRDHDGSAYRYPAIIQLQLFKGSFRSQANQLWSRKLKENDSRNNVTHGRGHGVNTQEQRSKVPRLQLKVNDGATAPSHSDNADAMDTSSNPNRTDAVRTTENRSVISKTIAQFQAGIDGLKSIKTEHAELKKQFKSAKESRARLLKQETSFLEAQKEVEELKSSLDVTTGDLRAESKRLAKARFDRQEACGERDKMTEKLDKLTGAAKAVMNRCGWMTEERCGKEDGRFAEGF